MCLGVFMFAYGMAIATSTMKYDSIFADLLGQSLSLTIVAVFAYSATAYCIGSFMRRGSSMVPFIVMAIAFFDYVAALRESDLPGPTRSVAFWIASRCANGWPVTRETVAADSGFSRATVTRAVAELREKGWLVSDRNRRQGNSYQVSIPRLLSAQSEPVTGSERAYKEAHSEPKEAQSEPLKKFL